MSEAAPSQPDMHLETIHPLNLADPASQILRDSWKPPCLWYSPEYLRWQFRFSGSAAAIGVAAFDDEEPVGFCAVVPRWMRVGPDRIGVHLLSFLAVRPVWRGRSLAMAIYRSLIETLRETGGPIVAFVEPETVAEQVLFRNFEDAGYRRRSLGKCRTYAYLARPERGIIAASAEEADEGEFLEAMALCLAPEILWNDPGLDQLTHYRQDPRGRVLVVIRDPARLPIGAAMVVLSEVTTPHGLEYVPMIDSVYLPDPSADALKALLRFAGQHWADRSTSTVVTAPNLQGIDPGLLRTVGLRATQSCFHSYGFTAEESDPLRGASGTNLEVV